jgi:hypothetical protein
MAKDKKDSKKDARPPIGPDTEYSRKRQDKLLDTQRDGREIGRQEGFNRQQRSAGLGGVIGTPGAYIERGAQFIGDKFDDIDAYLSEKAGMQERLPKKVRKRMQRKQKGWFSQVLQAVRSGLTVLLKKVKLVEGWCNHG